MGQYEAVILDVDGTLVDTNDAHARAFHEAIMNHGYNVNFPDVRRLIGMGSDNLLPEAIDVPKDSPIRKQIAEERRLLFQEKYLPHVRPFPGVRDLVKRLRADGLRVIVASSGDADEVEHLLRLAEVDDLVEGSTSAADAKNSKPDPDVIHAALNRLQGTRAVMIGDSPYDIEAAGKAGVPVIALRSGGFSDRDLAGAIAIYDSPGHLLAHYKQSPLGR